MDFQARLPARVPISVIIPAYNGAATLAGAIESILRQTHAPEEIIVCDDCSTDATAEVAARYSGRVECVRRPKNGGLSANRNTAVQVARGDWLLFLDQDDELLPHALEALVTTAEKTNAGVVYGYVLLRSGEQARLHGLHGRWASRRCLQRQISGGRPSQPPAALCFGVRWSTRWASSTRRSGRQKIANSGCVAE
jgi:glycosyltransferase involved in cell wall biosynthesis